MKKLELCTFIALLLFSKSGWTAQLNSSTQNM